MGAGAALLGRDPELHERLRAAGWAPTVQRTTSADPDGPEIARQFDLLRQLAADVRGARRRGTFPLVLAGGCLSATAVVAGAAPHERVGAVWLDAHADLDTPEDNRSGFLDVMALSLLNGACWEAQRATVPEAGVVAPEHVALLGVRDLAGHQREQVERTPAAVVPGAFTAEEAEAAISGLPRRLYLHVDLDVLDTSVGRANAYAAPGGPSLEAVLGAVDAAFDHGQVVAATLSAYDPAADRDGGVLGAARAIAERIARRARGQRR